MQRSRRGFTLVELLVVIGVIAVLIAMLLPALTSARRQANVVKCLSNLRQIGLAFQVYEREYKGYWPVVIHHEGNASYLFKPGTGDRWWMDFIAPYIVGKKAISTTEDLNQIRDSYDRFACPDYDRASQPNNHKDPFYEPNPLGPTALIGYAMHYHPTFYDDEIGGMAWDQVLSRIPAITRTGIPGMYVKASVWTRKGSDRGLIADAQGAIIFTLRNYGKSTTLFQPYINPPAFVFGTDFTVDGMRHTKPQAVTFNFTLARRACAQLAKRKTTNLLYCDGHAATVSVPEVWNSIHNPGRDRTGP